MKFVKTFDSICNSIQNTDDGMANVEVQVVVAYKFFKNAKLIHKNFHLP